MDTHQEINISKRGTTSSREEDSLKDKSGSWSDVISHGLSLRWQPQRNRSFLSKTVYKSTSSPPREDKHALVRNLESWWQGLASPPCVQHSFFFSDQIVTRKLTLWEEKSQSPVPSNLYSTFFFFPLYYFLTLYLVILYIGRRPSFFNAMHIYTLFNPSMFLLFICLCVICNLGLWCVHNKWYLFILLSVLAELHSTLGYCMSPTAQKGH